MVRIARTVPSLAVRRNQARRFGLSNRLLLPPPHLGGLGLLFLLHLRPAMGKVFDQYNTYNKFLRAGWYLHPLARSCLTAEQHNREPRNALSPRYPNLVGMVRHNVSGALEFL